MNFQINSTFQKTLLVIVGVLFMGSMAQATVQITSASQLTSNPTDCDTISYTFSGTLGAANYSYSGITWSVSGSVLTIKVEYTSGGIILPAIVQFSQTGHLTGVPAGTYTVVAQGVLNSTVTSTYNGLPSINVLTCCGTKASYALPSTKYCLGDTIALNNTSSGASAQFWYANGSLVDTSVHYSTIANTVGTYTYKLLVTAPCGNDSVTKNVVVLDNMSLPGDTSICLNASLTISGPPDWDVYDWSNKAKSQSITVTQGGTYVLTTKTNGGCAQTDSIVVTAVGPAFSLGADTSICHGDSLTLDAGAVWDTVSWFQGPLDRFYTVTTAGNYVAEVTNSIGCKFQDVIKVTVVGDNLAVTGSDTVCPGEGVTLQATGTGWVSYKWSSGQTFKTIRGYDAGMYFVTATHTDGCVVVDTGFITHHPIPQIDLGEDTTICIGDSLVLNVATGDSVLWEDGSTQATRVLNAAGTYRIEVTNALGCTNKDTLVLALLDCDTVVQGPDAVQEWTLKASFRMYPNPSSGMIYLERIADQSASYSVEVYSMQGALVFRQESNEGSAVQSLDLSHLPAGSFMVHILEGEKRAVLPLQMHQQR